MKVLSQEQVLLYNPSGYSLATASYWCSVCSYSIELVELVPYAEIRHTLPALYAHSALRHQPGLF